mmetsp:Transcript_8117/g.9214  ORF Transcript_8117/g.9214 Transcript_8117/m.9214 type:complete len:115 (-) Transcript_8117:540-884(-)
MLATRADRDVDDKVSKTLFDETRDRVNGRLRDISNHGEELEGRLKIIERYTEEMKRSNAALNLEPVRRKSFSAPDFEGVHKKIVDLEGYIETLRQNIRSVDQRMKKEIIALSDK